MQISVEGVKPQLSAWILLVLANSIYMSATIILIFNENIDHGVCCLFSDEMSDGVSQAGCNGLWGI